MPLLAIEPLLVDAFLQAGYLAENQNAMPDSAKIFNCVYNWLAIRKKVLNTCAILPVLVFLGTSTKPPTFGILAAPQDSKASNEPPRKTPGESTESHRALAAKIILDQVSAVASEDQRHV